MSTGKIVQVIGPTVDLEFERGNLPNIYNAISIKNEEKNTELILEVAQHIGDDAVRCISMGSTEGLVRGMTATDLEKPISVPAIAEYRDKENT